MEPETQSVGESGAWIKWIVGIIVAVVVIWLVVSWNKTSPNPTPAKETGPAKIGTVKIGFVGPLSGDGASFGETEKNAIEMSLAQVQASGLLRDGQIEMIYEDGKCGAKDAITAAQKLIQVDGVKVILGGTCSSETLAIAPIAEQNQVVLLSAFSSNPAITDSGDFIFRNSPSDADVAKIDAELIITKGYKKVAIVSENNDYAQGVAKVMKDTFAAKGITVVLDENFNGGTTDFRNIVLKLKQSGADVVYVNPGSSGKTGALLVKQLREAGSKMAVHGNFSLGTPDAFATGGKYLEGVIISDSIKFGSAMTTLLANYETKFGSKAANDFEFGASYDRIQIIARALAAVGNDAVKIKQYLYTMPDYAGVIGAYHFDQNGDMIGGPFFTNYVIRGGAKELLSN